MKMDDLFPSKYLKASDADPAVTLTIDRVTQEVMKNRDDQDETKAVLYFKDAPKPLVLNRTNAKAIANMYGDDTDDWTGRRVTLTTVMVDAFGQTQPALRVDPRKPAPSKDEVISHFRALYEKAHKVGVKGLENYVINPDQPIEEILDLGKELKAKVKEAEAATELGF